MAADFVEGERDILDTIPGPLPVGVVREDVLALVMGPVLALSRGWLAVACVGVGCMLSPGSRTGVAVVVCRGGSAVLVAALNLGPTVVGVGKAGVRALSWGRSWVLVSEREERL